MTSERSRKLREANPNIADGYDRGSEKIRIAKMLRAWRKASGLTTQQVAEKMEIDEEDVARLEAFDVESAPSVSDVIAFAHACNHSFVMGGVPDRRQEQTVGRRYAEIAGIQLDMENGSGIKIIRTPMRTMEHRPTVTVRVSDDIASAVVEEESDREDGTDDSATIMSKDSFVQL